MKPGVLNIPGVLNTLDNKDSIVSDSILGAKLTIYIASDDRQEENLSIDVASDNDKREQNLWIYCKRQQTRGKSIEMYCRGNMRGEIYLYILPKRKNLSIYIASDDRRGGNLSIDRASDNT